MPRFLIYFLSSLIAIFWFIFPVYGNDGTGAGNAGATCKNELIDKNIAEGSGVIKKTKASLALPVFQDDIAPMLEQIRVAIPDCYQAMRVALQKTWKFDPDYQFNKCKTENPDYISRNQTEKVACQTLDAPGKLGEVILDTNWFLMVDPHKCKKPRNARENRLVRERQRYLIIHELLLGITLGKTPRPEATDAVFKELIRQPLNIDRLKSVLNSSKFFLAYETTDDLINSARMEAPNSVPQTLTNSAMGATQWMKICNDNVIRSMDPTKTYRTDHDSAVIKLAIAAFIKHGPQNCPESMHMVPDLLDDPIITLKAGTGGDDALWLDYVNKNSFGEISGSCFEPIECNEASVHAAYNMDAAIRRLSSSQSSPCNMNPGLATDGELNLIDGSCTYENPMILEGDEALPIYNDSGDPRDIGSKRPANTSALGFCQRQGKKLVQTAGVGCFPNVCNAPAAALLNEDGSLAGKITTLLRPGTGGVVLKMVCK